MKFNSLSENDYKMSQQWNFNTIGVLHCPCKEKFGVPRQSGLVPELAGYIEMHAPYDRIEAFDQLLDFSHIWVVSVFHQALRETWQPSVRPPRLGGNTRVGVFASRSPFRPNSLALSVFKLERIVQQDSHLRVHVSGIDLMDGTPVLDIKPYLPYADQVSGATEGYTKTLPSTLVSVNFSESVQQAVAIASKAWEIDLMQLITALIQQDPRPAYQTVGKSTTRREYGFQLYDFNIRFEVNDGIALVTQFTKL